MNQLSFTHSDHGEGQNELLPFKVALIKQRKVIDAPAGGPQVVR